MDKIMKFYSHILAEWYQVDPASIEIQEEPCLKRASVIKFICIGCYFSFVAFVILMSWAVSCKDRAIRDELNKKPGVISEHMSRKVITPRVNLE